MIARAYTVAFQGVDARLVEVQCAVTAGLPAFSIVGYNCKPFRQLCFELFSFHTLKMSSRPKACCPSVRR